MAPVSAVLLASIPSPSSGVYHVGPLTIHMYGVMLLLAIAAAIWLTGRRWVRWGGDWDLVYRMSIWGVIVGIIGARLYHDITSWNQDSAIHDALVRAVRRLVGRARDLGRRSRSACSPGRWIVRRSGASVALFMDAVAPGLLLAQAIGRRGNWWNQELYGKHTSCRGGSRSTEGRGGHLPPGLPLRVSLGHLGRGPAALDRPALQDPPARALHALRRDTTRLSASSRRSCESIRPATSAVSA